MPDASIIIPVFNVESYIEECLESVLCQSLEELEILCVDDCGSDNSMKIVEMFAGRDERISILRHEKNRGLGPARNTGLGVATGKYIYFLDSDDMIDNSHALANLVARAEKTNADICIGHGITFADDPSDQDLQKWCLVYKKYIRPMPVWQYKVTEYNFVESVYNFPGIACGRLYKRNFLQKNHLTFIDANILHEDEGFHRKTMSVLPTITVCSEAVFRYRQRKGSLLRLSDEERVARERMSMTGIMHDVFTWLRKYSGHSQIFISHLLAVADDEDLFAGIRDPGERLPYPSVMDYARPASPEAISSLEKAILTFPPRNHDCQDAGCANLLARIGQHLLQIGIFNDEKNNLHGTKSSLCSQTGRFCIETLACTVARDMLMLQQNFPRCSATSRTGLVSRHRKHLALAMYFAYPIWLKSLKNFWGARVNHEGKILGLFYTKYSGAREEQDIVSSSNENAVDSLEHALDGYDGQDTALNYLLAKLLITGLNSFESIVTDSMVLAVCVACLGKPVWLMANQEISTAQKDCLLQFKNLAIVASLSELPVSKKSMMGCSEASNFAIESLPRNVESFCIAWINALALLSNGQVVNKP